MKEFHRRDFANRTGLAQAWTVKSVDRLFTEKASRLQFRAPFLEPESKFMQTKRRRPGVENAKGKLLC